MNLYSAGSGGSQLRVRVVRVGGRCVRGWVIGNTEAKGEFLNQELMENLTASPISFF